MEEGYLYDFKYLNLSVSGTLEVNTLDISNISVTGTFSATGDLSIGTGGNQLFVDVSESQVGIGTTTMNARLEVLDSSGAQLRLAYDSDSYTDFTVDSSSNLVISTGESGTITLSDATTFGSDITVGGHIVADTDEAKNIFTDVSSSDITIGSGTSRVIVQNLYVQDNLVNDLKVEDRIIVLAQGRTGNPDTTGDSGVIIERGDESNIFFGYDESADKFVIGSTSGTDGDLTITDDQTFKASSFEGTITTASQPNITTVGALNGGSITSGFGNIDIQASGSYSVGGIAIISDSAGTTTLNNIDSLDATTEATIESAIDTLSNLTTASSLTTVGALNSGSITNGFGNIDIQASGSYSIGGIAIISDSAGTTTLNNIDALDATTEATIESAIDTLNNLTTVGALNSGSITSGFGNIDIQASGSYSVGGVTIISDSTGTTTLNNIDALDATTEATIESAIDTLSNLTTVGSLNSGSITSGFGNIDIQASGSYSVGGVAIISDSAGTTTLSNIDALDATTEATIESAIDTLSNLTTASSLTTVGALNSGSITSGFGNIDNGTNNITTGGLLSLDTDADVDDTTADSASGRFTIGTGGDLNLYHGGTNSYIVNLTGDLIIGTEGVGGGSVIIDAENDTVEIKYSGTTGATFSTTGLDIASGDSYSIGTTSVLSADTLGSGVTTSSLTTVGALNSGSITSGFGAIDNGASNITTTGQISGGTLTDGTVSITGGALNGVSSIDATTEATIESAIDTLANLTSFGSAGATTNIVAGDLTMYNAVNDGNPTISLGSSATNRFEILTTYNTGAQTLKETVFKTYTSSATADDGRMIFSVDETDKMTIDDTGVGIGTASPQTTCHVAGNAEVFALEGTNHCFLRFYPRGVSTGTKGYFGFAGGGGTTDLYLMNQDTGNLYFGTSSTTRMTINSSGNVGIGTTSPDSTLQVVGDLKVDQDVYIPSLTTNRVVKAGAGGLLSDTLIQDDGTTITLSALTESYGTSKVFASQNTNYEILGGYQTNFTTPTFKSSLDALGNNKFELFNNSGSAIFTHTNDYITIETNTANPAVRIQQAGTGDAFQVYDVASDSTYFSIDDEGDVAIKRGSKLNTSCLTMVGIENTGGVNSINFDTCSFVGGFNYWSKFMGMGCSINRANGEITMYNDGLNFILASYIISDGGHLHFGARYEDVGDTSNRTETLSTFEPDFTRMYISGANGYIGVGTVSPQTVFHIRNNSEPNIILDNPDGTRTTGFYFRKAGGNVNYITSNTGGDFRITNQTNGATLLHTQSSDFTYLYGGDIYMAARVMPLSDNAYDLGAGGNRWQDIFAVNNLIQTSDRNLKKDIESLNKTDSLTFIDSLNPVKYRWIENSSNRYHWGLIAQDVQSALTSNSLSPDEYGLFINSPTQTHTKERDGEAQTIDKGNQMGLRYMELMAPMIAAIQELKSKNNTLEINTTNKIAALCDKTDNLTNQITNDIKNELKTEITADVETTVNTAINDINTTKNEIQSIFADVIEIDENTVKIGKLEVEKDSGNLTLGGSLKTVNQIQDADFGARGAPEEGMLMCGLGVGGDVEKCSIVNDKTVSGVCNANGELQVGGECWIWICSAGGGTIDEGDFITTSDFDGYGMKQADDILHGYTFAKIIESVNFGRLADADKRLINHRGEVVLEQVYNNLPADRKAIAYKAKCKICCV